uniref:PRELI/MSF1 domain-containing protein n=1 Tax=Lygus hesperus TaxID=30085 RepID=A0A0K8TH24_LYGHE
MFLSLKKSQTQEGPSMSCTKRTVSMLNPFPKFFQRVKLLKEETVAFFEDIWTQESERRVWIRSRNLTWEEEISIGSVVYVSPSENNQNWTTWEDITALDFDHCGKYGLILELFLKRKMENENSQYKGDGSYFRENGRTRTDLIVCEQ